MSLTGFKNVSIFNNSFNLDLQNKMKGISKGFLEIPAFPNYKYLLMY
jgi:hypothetical protein